MTIYNPVNHAVSSAVGHPVALPYADNQDTTPATVTFDSDPAVTFDGDSDVTFGVE